MSKITVENCLISLMGMPEYEVGKDERAKAWAVVIQLCAELGMNGTRSTGIENVVEFITELSQRPKLVDPPLPKWWRIVLRILGTPPVFFIYGMAGCWKLWKYGGLITIGGKPKNETE